MSISSHELRDKGSSALRHSKRAAFDHFADLVIGVVFMVLVAYLVFTFVGTKKTAEQAIIDSASSEADASRDFLVLLRTPMDDGRMVSEHIVTAYLNDTLIDLSIKNPLTQTVYRFFNRYYKASDVFWNLQVSEELYDGNIKYYYTFNKIRSFQDGTQGGKDPCMFNVKTMSTVRLPVHRSDVKNLVLEQRKCFSFE